MQKPTLSDTRSAPPAGWSEYRAAEEKWKCSWVRS